MPRDGRKDCASCAPPEWAAGVNEAKETKSWLCQQGLSLSWHWRLIKGVVWCVPDGLFSTNFQELCGFVPKTD
jgi:hypothetical protein